MPRKQVSILQAVQALVPAIAFEIWITEDVTKFLHVSKEKVYQLIKEEGLPILDVEGHGYRFISVSVAMWAIMHQKVV